MSSLGGFVCQEVAELPYSAVACACVHASLRLVENMKTENNRLSGKISPNQNTDFRSLFVLKICVCFIRTTFENPDYSHISVCSERKWVHVWPIPHFFEAVHTRVLSHRQHNFTILCCLCLCLCLVFCLDSVACIR